MSTTAELRELAREVAEAESNLTAMRARRDAAIAQAAAEGIRQRDIVESTGLTREQVRRIVLAGKGDGRAT